MDVPTTAALAGYVRAVRSDSAAIGWNQLGEPIIFDIRRPGQWWRACLEDFVLLNSFRTGVAKPIRDSCLEAQNRIGSIDLEAMEDRVYRLVELGILVIDRAPADSYTQEMVAAYEKGRPFPAMVASTVVSGANVCAGTEILDIGTGLGELSVLLSQISDQVTGIDVSESFLRAARTRNSKYGGRVRFEKRSGDLLAFGEDRYEVVTAVQSFHWLDPYWATQGLYRCLRIGGSFFAVESKPVLAAEHPLRALLAFGDGDHDGMDERCRRHALRYTNLFTALRTGSSHLCLKSVSLFRQQRPFDIEFARAYFFDGQIATAMRGCRDPWRALDALLEAFGSDKQDTESCLYWLVLQFQHLPGAAGRSDGLEVRWPEATDIPFHAG